MAIAVWDVVAAEFPACIANVGRIELEPGAFNVVPGRARIGLECRSVDPDELERLAARIVERVRTAAAECRLELVIERVGHWAPAATDPSVRLAVQRAAETLGLSFMCMPSGAGHDAQVLAGIVPVGMVFVPSVAGISHDPSEHTHWGDCVNGANVLLGAALELALAASLSPSGARTSRTDRPSHRVESSPVRFSMHHPPAGVNLIRLER